MFIAQSLVQVIMLATCACSACNRLTWPLIHLSAPISLYSASLPSCAVVGNERLIKIPGRGTKCQRDLKWLCFSCCVSGARWPSLSPHGSSIAVQPWPGTNQAFLSADLRSALPLRSLWMQWVKGNWHLIADQHHCLDLIHSLPMANHKGKAWQHVAWVKAGLNPALGWLYSMYSISFDLFPAFTRAGLTPNDVSVWTIQEEHTSLLHLWGQYSMPCQEHRGKYNVDTHIL